MTLLITLMTCYYIQSAGSANRDAIVTLGVLAVAIVFFFTEIIPLAVTSLMIPVVLVVLGAIDGKLAYASLANPTIVLFGGMFIVGGALFETGVAKAMGDMIVKLAKGNSHRMMIGMMVVTMLLSSVLSNTSTVAVLLPVCIGIADAGHFSRAKLLLPVAMLASAGGMISLVGTPPNGTANAVMTNGGYPAFGFFEFAWVGVPVALVSILYITFIGHRFLPKETQMDREESFETIHLANKTLSKKLTAGGIMLVTVILMFTEIYPPHIVAVAGAMMCIITHCISEQQAYHAIDWVTIFLFAGTLSLASAIDQTGAGVMIADGIISLMGGTQNPYVLMTILFLIAAGLTQFMSNTAAAALLAPIGLSIAQVIGANPQAIVLAIGIACSAAYCTPIATPPNTLIMGPAHLKFMDYVKMGLPLLFLTYLVCILIIPRVWPFF